MNEKIETGQLFSIYDEVSNGFLSSVVTQACLNVVAKVLVVSYMSMK